LGTAQGVLLTHTNLVDTIASMKAFVASVEAAFDEDDVFLSFLPLAHIFDR